MKIMKIALTLLFVLSASVIVQADTNTLNELERYAEKIVPEKFKKINADEDGLSSSMAFQKDDTMIQLTLSNDLESQMETEEKLIIGGKPAQFFRPMGETSGGLFILIDSKTSLTIIYMLGFSSDKSVTLQTMKKITKGLKFK